MHFSQDMYCEKQYKIPGNISYEFFTNTAAKSSLQRRHEGDGGLPVLKEIAAPLSNKHYK
ncbi:MAG: hypothetical protein IJM34_10680 [Lachnospiraceae bacterium]|nr:hypothetical protein [Lachnospiraceae bacterium]